MFGGAGGRGLDETGFVLVTANELRLLDAWPCHLSRSGAVDWSALLNVMSLAAQRKNDPFREAVRVQERLFTTRPIVLGVEESLRHPDVPCGLKTDAERARHVRKRVREMLNSCGEWELYPTPTEVAVKDVRSLVMPQPWRKSGPLPPEGGVPTRDGTPPSGGSGIISPVTEALLSLSPAEGESPPRGPLSCCSDWEGERGQYPRGSLNSLGAPGQSSQLRPVLSVPQALEKVGTGTLCVLSESDDGKIYGRSLTVADRLGDDRVILAKWIRRLTNWNGPQVPLAVWKDKIE